jgi:undecaprenyl-diphosphatase
MAAAAVIGASGRPLPLGRTILVQLASSVANRLAPGGIGGVATNVRYLERSGLRRPEAMAAVALTTAAGFVVHALALASAAALLSDADIQPIRLPRRWGLLVAIVAVTTLLGLVFWSPVGRRLLPQARQAARSLLAVFQRPRQATLVFAGAAGYVLALSFALRAFGAHPPLLYVAAAYLAGAAIGAASPTPGGLGAVEAALVAALTRLDVPGGAAIAGVLSFRLVTYWLPIVAGVAAFHTLRRNGAL